MRTASTPIRGGFLVAFASLTVAGCAGGDQGLDAESLAQQVQNQIGETVGVTPERVVCAGGLEPEVGATQECAQEQANVWQAVTVTFELETDPAGIPPPDYAK